MILANKVIVALDTADEVKALALLDALKGQPIWIKIGMEAFYSHGTSIILLAKSRGFKVFLDLKLHDIPNTVGESMKALLKLPIDMINVHAAGGSDMMKKAAEAIHNAPNGRPLLIAVTQLTSTTSAQMNREQRIQGDITESVSHYAKLAKDCGCDGVVSSPLEVSAIKLICGQKFLTVTPGIRLKDGDEQDQKRITTPREALLLGTDYMVIGRPITQAPNPKVALETILKGM